MSDFKIGIDSYGLDPLQLSPMEVLKWAHRNGAEGVQFSGLAPEMRSKIDRYYLKDLKQYADSMNLYLEWGGFQHIPRDMSSWGRKEIFESNSEVAEEASTLGVRIVRSCSGGLMRWNPKNPETGILLKETADELRSQLQILRDHNVIMAIETHFEFTTFELLRMFEMCEVEPGDCIGICLDTMNLMTMLEHPLFATERVLPWIVSTHVKDGYVIFNDAGLITFPTEIGGGIVDFEGIVRLLKQIPAEINLNIEDHGGSFILPIKDISFVKGFPDADAVELLCLLHQAEKAKGKGCSVTERSNWPEICEERMRSNISKLKSILDVAE